MVKECLADLQPGDNFKDFLVLRSKVERKKGEGPELKLTLFDGSRESKAKKWKANDSEIEEVAQSQFLLVCGSVDLPKPGSIFHDEITLTSLHPVSQPENIERFLKSYPDSHKEDVKHFSSLMRSVNESHLNQLLKAIFDPAKSTWKEFKSACAAQYRHHAYRGGLIEHSGEVAALCDKACQVLPHLRRDFLVTCALLHDIGKLEEMQHGLSAGEFTESGTLVGHTVSGAMLIGQAASEIPDFPKNLKSGLMHMILSHHGQPDFGAAKTPVCAEAWVLHECDNMSAKAHEYQKILASEAGSGQFSVKRGQGEYFFIGDFGMSNRSDLDISATSVKIFSTEEVLEKEPVPSFTTVRLPIRGLVAAGSPEQSNADDNSEDEETREVVPPTGGADFLVRVTGDSMVDEGIREHDLLFVKKIEAPKNGDIVVAHVGAPGEVVKRFRYDSAANAGQEKKWLESENSSKNYPDILVDNDTRIRGKVVGLLRDF